jgi:hypothetical protein
MSGNQRRNIGLKRPLVDLSFEPKSSSKDAVVQEIWQVESLTVWATVLVPKLGKLSSRDIS